MALTVGQENNVNVFLVDVDLIFHHYSPYGQPAEFQTRISQAGMLPSKSSTFGIPFIFPGQLLHNPACDRVPTTLVLLLRQPYQHIDKRRVSHQVAHRPREALVEQVRRVKDAELEQYVDAKQADDLGVTRCEDLAEGGGEGPGGEVLEQVVVGAAQAEGEAAELADVLARVAVVIGVAADGQARGGEGS